MSYAHFAEPPRPAPSPLMLSDRLIALARDADHAGLRAAAVCLIGLAHDVLDLSRCS